MGNNFYKILGSIFMAVSAILYTIERITASISWSLIAAAHASHGSIFNVPLKYPGLFDNFFVWFLFLIGFVILAYGFPRKG
ncbi:hypothetical protein [Paenibacillus tuaregi]|uniref:hypothetical protein n=1 Tax=Paenibacillus tuaregi TaxID=1816681 RepID=UPI000838C0FE|nr:hypothetical protein [Paenibacillus tuaregi]